MSLVSLTLDCAASDLTHDCEHRAQGAEVLPEGLGIALDLQLTMDGVGHGPDVVVHRRRHRLDELGPGADRGAQRELPSHHVGVKPIGHSLDAAVPDDDQIVLVLDADDEIGAEEPADDSKDAIFVDLPGPIFDPFHVEMCRRSIPSHGSMPLAYVDGVPMSFAFMPRLMPAKGSPPVHSGRRSWRS